MQRKTGFCAWLLILASLLCATKAGAVQAVASHTVFYKPSANGDSAVIEVYWQIDPLTLHYTREEGKIRATVITSLRITPSGSEKPALEEKYKLVTDAASTDEAAAKNLLEGKRYVLPQGRYNISLTLSDPKNTRADFIYTDSVQAVVTTSNAFYSSLQMLDTAFENNTPSPFLRRGMQQFPSAAGILENGHPVLHVYYELYHTESLARSAFPLVQRTYITLKSSEAPFPELTVVDTIRSAAAMLPFLRMINTETLKSGNYYVRTSLRDKAGVLLAAEKSFYQSINKNPKEAAPVKKESVPDTAAVPAEQIQTLNIGKTFIGKYPPAQLRAILKMVSPVATPDERLAIQNFLRRPDEMYMRFFLYNFFLQRNAKDPGAAWKAYSDTVRQVNKQFTSGNTMGYETDRGAIYLHYGKPLERISMPNENGARPYEIWTYNDIGGQHDLSVFLFYQPAFAVGNLVLLHSTLNTELHNPGWRGLLYTSGTINESSRAEQYLGNR